MSSQSSHKSVISKREIGAFLISNVSAPFLFSGFASHICLLLSLTSSVSFHVCFQILFIGILGKSIHANNRLPKNRESLVINYTTDPIGWAHLSKKKICIPPSQRNSPSDACSTLSKWKYLEVPVFVVIFLRQRYFPFIT